MLNRGDFIVARDMKCLDLLIAQTPGASKSYLRYEQCATGVPFSPTVRGCSGRRPLSYPCSRQ